MTTYIQINCIAYDNISDPDELAILEAISGTDAAARFAYIVDGDESLIRETSLNPIYGENETFSAQELADMIEDGEHDDIQRVVIDANVDGISDFLEELGFQRMKGYYPSEPVYQRRQ